MVPYVCSQPCDDRGGDHRQGSVHRPCVGRVRQAFHDRPWSPTDLESEMADGPAPPATSVSGALSRAAIERHTRPGETWDQVREHL